MPKPRSRGALVGVVAAVAASLLTSGCAGPPPGAGAQDDRPVVLATFTVLADIASVVAGPDARVESLLDVGAEVHGYEPSPGDLRRAADADLLLANGLGLEAWFERLVAPLDIPRVVVTDDIYPLPVAGSPHVNPHAWMSPREGRGYVAAVVDALGELDPARAEAYATRGARYAEELRELEEVLVARLATIAPERRVLVTCEGAFSYLARDAGLAEAYLWPVNAERQGTPRQVARTIRTVRAREVPAVFCESTVAPTAQEQVARETGARLAGTLHVDSLSLPDGPVPTYLDLLRHDVETIIAGLATTPAGGGTP